MKYRQLVNFEPIESVIQLEQADSHDLARRLVETFVVSDRMAEQLTDLGFAHLQFDKPADNKGVLVVGNYGTGKSHLLSFLSALAEHTDMLEVVKHKKVARAAKAITAGFKVARLEIGSTKKSLRNIVCGKLDDFLAGLGLSYSFPPAEQVTNNKDHLSEMMGEFNERFPDHGLLLVVDELLDYLRSRNEHELILDLGFLREVGEVCKNVRFRFVAGLQETLFDNPKFQFVAESVRRVRDRFEQLRIVRQDVAYVVSERLLAKTEKQKAQIREHLQKFTPLYGSMAERLEEFVRLFPVHPAYLDIFERISIAEKREVLKTLSAEIRKRLDEEVPQDQPGLVSYDSYWGHLQDNASIRAIPEVREVIDMSKVVENRIQQAFTKPVYRPMALRIVQGLSVHRLSTDDIYAPIGPTVEELRDSLCLYQMIPERTSDFLRTTVEACLREIVNTMSGQYVAYNNENDQYYLDLKKDIDYDAKIQDKGDSLSPAQLDRYYFDALTRVLECADQTYVRGYRIWEHELEWRDHKVSRRGYLFFGAPNERSTTQPPRDFYLYFLQPFEPPVYDDQQLADEVFFKLNQTDEAFLRTLRLYAGAWEMALSASSGTRSVYEGKANDHLKNLVAWLRQHMLTAYEVTHQGVPKKMVEWLKGHRTGNATVRDLVESTGSFCLASCFKDRYPEYPTFNATVSVSSLAQVVEDAARWLAGGARNNVAIAVLDGLELLEGEKVKPQNSRYARAVLAKLDGKPRSQVLNRKELLTVRNDVEVESQFQLEPELLVLVLLGLVQNGNLSLSLSGKKIDAANLADAAKTPVEQLLAFRHVERPRDLPLAELVALFDLLGLPEGLVRNPDTREEAVVRLRTRGTEVIERVVAAKQQVQSGLPCWGGELLAPEVRDQYRGRLDDLQTFLEKLQAFNTPGKLKNFTASEDDVRAQAEGLVLIKQVEDLNSLVQELTALTGYLATAAAVLPPQDPWRSKMEGVRGEWRTQLLDPATRDTPDFRQKINRALQKAKEEFKGQYFKLHQKARLNVNEDQKKKELIKDPRLERLKKLAGVSLLPHQSLTDLQTRLANLKPCYALVKDDLDASATCPHCGFRPVEEAPGTGAIGVLEQIDGQADTLLEQWTKALLENLEDPSARGSIKLLPENQRSAINEFLKAKELPERVSNELVQGIQAALSGLTAISIAPDDLLTALGDGATACTVEQFRSRFDEFMQKTLRGRDQTKVRLVIKKAGAEEGQV